MYTTLVLIYFLIRLLPLVSCHELHETTGSQSLAFKPNNASMGTKQATSISTPKSLSSTSVHLTLTSALQSKVLKDNAAPPSDTTSTITRNGGTKTVPSEPLICYAHPELSTSWCVIHGITVAVPKTMSSSISASISTRLSIPLKSNFVSSGSSQDSTSTIVETKNLCSEREGKLCSGTKSTMQISVPTLLGGFNCTTLSDGELQCFRTGGVINVLATTTTYGGSHESSTNANTTSSTATPKSASQEMNSTKIITTRPTVVMTTSNIVVTPSPTQTSAESVTTSSSVARGENLKNQDLQGVLLIPMLYAAFGI